MIVQSQPLPQKENRAFGGFSVKYKPGNYSAMETKLRRHRPKALLFTRAPLQRVGLMHARNETSVSHPNVQKHGKPLDAVSSICSSWIYMVSVACKQKTYTYALDFSRPYIYIIYNMVCLSSASYCSYGRQKFVDVCKQRTSA